MADRFKAVLLFGAPGAGKGTQGSLLGHIPGFFHMSTGDMFRALDKESELGRTFAAHSSKGELVPDELTIKLWRTYMDQQIEMGNYDPRTQLLVLDGIPRTTQQVSLMDEQIDVLGVIHLSAENREDMIARLQKRAIEQHRVDDAKEEVVRNRLDVYERETRPVLDRYDPTKVHEIDAIGTLAMVLSKILQVVAPIQANLNSQSPVSR